MSEQYKRCDACILRPPFDLPDLPPLQGEFIEVEGTKIYTSSGSPDAKHGLMIIYDIFGYFPQTLFGADILAAGNLPSSPPPPKRCYRVFMPDFFDGKPAPYELYPPQTADDEAKLDEFETGPGQPWPARHRMLKLQRTLAAAHPEITSWGVLGYCWGGYVALHSVRRSVEGMPFKAVAALHPGFPGQAANAAEIDVPVLALPSMDETEEEMAEFLKGMKKELLTFEVFQDQVHGWLAARGDLKDAKVMKEFERGYQMMLDFFGDKM